jgi:hypothetical protein
MTTGRRAREWVSRTMSWKMLAVVVGATAATVSVFGGSTFMQVVPSLLR